MDPDYFLLDLEAQFDGLRRRQDAAHYRDMLLAEHGYYGLLDRLSGACGENVALWLSDGRTIRGQLCEVGADALMLIVENEWLCVRPGAIAAVQCQQGSVDPGRQRTPLLARVLREWRQHYLGIEVDSVLGRFVARICAVGQDYLDAELLSDSPALHLAAGERCQLPFASLVSVKPSLFEAVSRHQ